MRRDLSRYVFAKECAIRIDKQQKERCNNVVIDNDVISLSHVNFSYGSKSILRDVSLTIPEKTTVAIVGPSGSGKTTLCNLMARFWDVQSGSVRLDAFRRRAAAHLHRPGHHEGRAHHHSGRGHRQCGPGK